MVETLLGVSLVRLFGQKVSDMTFKDKQGDPVKRFVRVFGFSFEGHYHALDAPVILLLEGDGAKVASNTPKAVKDSLNGDILEWVCDKSDDTVRLDEMTGSIEDILLEVEAGGDGYAGRISGGRVSGGRVSGGRVSGGRVSGKGD